MATTGAPVDYTTAAAAEEKAKLQKHFSRFDIYFFLICTIVGVDTLGQVASNGAEGLTWLLVLAVALLHPLRAPDGGAGCGVHRGGRPVRLDAPRMGTVHCLHQRRLLLVLEPGLDRRRARPADTRGRQHVLLRHLDGRVPVVRRRPDLHLVQRLVGDPLVRDRQVDPDARRVVPHAAARRLHDRRGHLRHLQRAQPAGGRRLLADLRALHRPRPVALLQLRRLRASERRRR